MKSSTLTLITSNICFGLCILIPIIFLIYFIKSKGKNKNYSLAIVIAIILFLIPYGAKLIIRLNGDNMIKINCYVNNICKENTSTTDDNDETTTTTTKKKETTTKTKKTVPTTKQSSSSTYYEKVKLIDGDKTDLGTTSNGYEIFQINGVTYIDGYLIANKTYSLPEDYIPTDTKKSAVGVTNTCNECINNTVMSAWNKMQADAKAAGIALKIGSGYRSYNTQKNIYNNYVKRDGQQQADTYSARPGSSEHQTALCFDICGTNLSSDKCISSAFNNTNEAKWINDNASKYGFIIRYPQGKQDKTGYKYESWHVRYVGTDLANELYNNGNWISMEEYFGVTSVYPNN